MNTVFFGSSTYVLPVLKKLKENYNVALIVTTSSDKSSSIIDYAKKHHLEYLVSTNLQDKNVEKLILEKQAKFAVLASFGQIITPNILNIFPMGIVNLHPSLLPFYRGPTPVQSAIINGENETGISLIKLDNLIDHGPILSQQKLEISNEDNISLHNKLFTLGAKLLINTLPLYLNGTLILKEQDHRKATFTKLLKRDSGYIDYKNPPSKETIARMIRAYHPWPGVWTRIELRGVVKNLKLLPQGMLQVEGKKVMSLKDFENGYPKEKEKIEKLI